MSNRMKRLAQFAAPAAMLASLLVTAGSAEARGGFDNAGVARAGLAEVGTRRPTGWSQEGECIMSVRRWVRAAGGTTAGSGTNTSYVASGAEDVGSWAAAAIGDVAQFTNGNDNDWSRVHTVVLSSINTDGSYGIVHANAAGYDQYGRWRTDSDGLVTTVPNWRPANSNGWYWRLWRFGTVRAGGGMVRAIRSQANGRYVSADLAAPGGHHAKLRARAGAVRGWERFAFEGDCTSARGCAIRSLANGQYVSAELAYGPYDNGLLRARSGGVGGWELFGVEGDCNTGCAIRSRANGRYVAAELAHAEPDYGMLRARATAVQGWERFVFVPA